MGEPASREGTELAGKYRLEQRLGAGGMGEVYRAENVLIGRPVAIKVMRAEFAQNRELVTRFLREARAANIVRHPNVVDILDIGEDESGVPFIVQELLEGEDLARRIETAGGKLSIDAALRFMVPILEAVAAGHERGVIHRDLKPENVFLAREGSKVVPKLLDFGVSQIRPAAGEAKITIVGQAMGTPAYMSPEQLRGVEVDARTDVWALGVIIYELLSGRRPFDAESPAELYFTIATTELTPLADVVAGAPPELANVVARCLRCKREERYTDAGELLKDVRPLWRSRIAGRYGAPDELSASIPPPRDSRQSREVAPTVAVRKADPPPAVPDLVIPQSVPKPAPPPKIAGPDPRAVAAATAPPRKASGIKLASIRPTVARVLRPISTIPPPAADVNAVAAWLWLFGSVAVGGFLMRIVHVPGLMNLGPTLGTIQPFFPTAAIVAIAIGCVAAGRRAFHAFRSGERALGIVFGLTVGAAALTASQIALEPGP